MFVYVMCLCLNIHIPLSSFEFFLKKFVARPEKKTNSCARPCKLGGFGRRLNNLYDRRNVLMNILFTINGFPL